MNRETEKLSSAKSVVFRPGQGMRKDLDNLAAELSRPNARVTISDILREGVTTYWPQMRAYLRARSAVGGISPEALARVVDAAAQAGALGVTPDEAIAALRQATKEKLSAAS